MLMYPEIDPIIFEVPLPFIEPLAVRWYGTMYLVGFLAAYLLLSWRAKRPNSGWNKEQVADLIFYGALGVILGARVGYVLFYNFGTFLDNPMSMFEVWKGGMSFHGGLLGVIFCTFLFSRKYKKNMWDILDFATPVAPLGIFAGRIGNFINGELVGRPTDLPWGMVFPHIDSLPRHPSQLYEAMMEGVVLFCILWVLYQKERPRFAMCGFFLIGYGAFRFSVEFARQPDAQLGFVALDWVTMGQVLSFPMIVLGLIFVYLAYGRKNAAS